MFSMKILFQILFVWQENDLGFSSDFEKIVLQKQQHQNSSLPYTHTISIKIRRDKGSISGPLGKGTQIFYETNKICVIVDFIV